MCFLSVSGWGHQATDCASVACLHCLLDIEKSVNARSSSNIRCHIYVPKDSIPYPSSQCLADPSRTVTFENITYSQPIVTPLRSVTDIPVTPAPGNSTRSLKYQMNAANRMHPSGQISASPWLFVLSLWLHVHVSIGLFACA